MRDDTRVVERETYVERERPALIVLDLRDPMEPRPLDEQATTQRLGLEYVVVLGAGPGGYVAAIRAGAAGYLLKSEPPERIAGCGRASTCVPRK